MNSIKNICLKKEDGIINEFGMCDKCKEKKELHSIKYGEKYCDKCIYIYSHDTGEFLYYTKYDKECEYLLRYAIKKRGVKWYRMARDKLFKKLKNEEKIQWLKQKKFWEKVDLGIDKECNEIFNKIEKWRL